MTHRPLAQEGGPTARWRSFAKYLPDHGWQVDVVSAPLRASGVEFAEDAGAARRVEARARLMARVGRVAAPVAALAGVRPEALPPSMAWALRGSRTVKARIASSRPDVILATAPPMVGVIAARMALGHDAPPFVAEMRDLWAGSPAFDRRGGLLTRIERRALDPAARVVVMGPEAEADLAARHPDLAPRIVSIPNGFEPELLERRGARTASHDPITLIHSGTLNAGRPLTPLLDALRGERYRGRFQLVLHGYLSPESRAEVAAAGALDVEVVPPSGWDEAVERIRAADVSVVSQSDAVGDRTAIASKVLEYLALGKPVLCLTDGGATEALLRRLGADALCARLSEPASIAAALDRLLGDDWPAALPPETLAPYSGRALAAAMAGLLDEITG